MRHHAWNIDMCRAGDLTGSGSRQKTCPGRTGVSGDVVFPFRLVLFQGCRNGAGQFGSDRLEFGDGTGQFLEAGVSSAKRHFSDNTGNTGGNRPDTGR